MLKEEEREAGGMKKHPSHTSTRSQQNLDLLVEIPVCHETASEAKAEEEAVTFHLCLYPYLWVPAVANGFFVQVFICS